MAAGFIDPVPGSAVLRPAVAMLLCVPGGLGNAGTGLMSLVRLVS